jgi:CheY-like chemotaxis protein
MVARTFAWITDVHLALVADIFHLNHKKMQLDSMSGRFAWNLQQKKRKKGPISEKVFIFTFLAVYITGREQSVSPAPALIVEPREAYMDVSPILPNYDRNLVRQRIQRTMPIHSGPGLSERGVLIADTISTRPPTGPIAPPVPQGLGEYKHPVTDPHYPATDRPDNPDDTIERVAEPGDRWAAESAYRYRLFSELPRTHDMRKRVEDEVRRRKKEGRPCPFYNAKDGTCRAVSIRCGERLQFSTRETASQQRLPHRCLYRPGQRSQYVIVVDADGAVRDFCRNTLSLFMDFDDTKILTVGSAEEALQLLNQNKLSRRSASLLITDQNLPRGSGYELVNELFQRNHNMDVLLLKSTDRAVRRPKEYFGETEIAPGRPLVRRILKKPFHSEDLVAVLRQMGY